MLLIIELIRRHYVVLTLMLLTAISVLSLSPIAELPPVPGTDKTHHFIAYAALILPLSIYQHKRLWWFVVGFALYSGLIEIIQPYVNRYGEWLDLAANCAGLLIGVVIAKALLKVFYKER